MFFCALLTYYNSVVTIFYLVFCTFAHDNVIFSLLNYYNHHDTIGSTAAQQDTRHDT